MLAKTVILISLAILSFWDMKSREIPIWFVLMIGSGGVLYEILFRPLSWQQATAGVLIGAVILLAAVLSGEKIGKGDGYVLCMSGIYLGFWENLALIFIAVLICGIFSAFLLFIKKCGKDTRLPFLPFLLAADLFLL